MFKDHTRITHRARPWSDDSTLGEDGILLTTDLLPRRTRVCIPEIALVAAIFEDALRCVQRASRGVTNVQSLEAYEWIASDRKDWLFTFVNVCDLLGVDASAVRARLQIADVRR